MTNNKLCNIISIIGCALASWHMGLMFFGISSAIWGVGFGILLALFGLFNYE